MKIFIFFVFLALKCLAYETAKSAPLPVILETEQELIQFDDIESNLNKFLNIKKEKPKTITEKKEEIKIIKKAETSNIDKKTPKAKKASAKKRFNKNAFFKESPIPKLKIRDFSKKITMASNALNSGQYEAAISEYKDVLKFSKNNIDALFGLAVAYQKNMQEMSAIELYNQVLDLEPNHESSLHNYMSIITTYKPEIAISELKKLESANPEFAPIPAQIALLYLNDNKLSEAIHYMETAILLDNENTDYKHNMAIIYDHSSQWNKALKYYRDVSQKIRSKALENRIRYLESL